jgi:hypothetical protein
MNVREFLDANPILFADWKKIPVEEALVGDSSQAAKPVKIIFDRTGWVPGGFGILVPPDGVYKYRIE